MTREQDWQNWRDRFDKTHNGVLRLFHDRAIWRAIKAMLDANPAVMRGGLGEYWLQSCYVTSQLIGMRRETGGDSSSIGLMRSLKGLESCPRMATRAWYEQQVRDDYPGRTPGELGEMYSLFGRFADQGALYIDAQHVTSDISTLRAVIGNVNTYTSKVIAHRDAPIARGAAQGIVITWGQLDAALDTIGQIHQKYYSLCHPGEALGFLTPLAPPMWTQMFQTAWMPAGFKIPDPWSNDPPRLHPI